MTERLFKILHTDGTSCNGGNARWSLPTQNEDGTWTPGEWMPAIVGKLVPCENGYHLARERDLLGWLNAAIYEAEYRGERIDEVDKIVVREARLTKRHTWNERIARLFACDCAEDALLIFERARPGDSRPRQAIEVARRYANGQATDDELSAARDAAWAAARDAAWAAAWAAAGDAAMAAGDAAMAARDAAGDAAWDAAMAAAGDAAWSAAWAHYTAWLLEYLDGARG